MFTRSISWLVVGLAAATVAACATTKTPPPTAKKIVDSDFQTATIGFYNVENLYDTADDPKTDDNNYLPTSPLLWDELRYRTKLSRLASVITELGSPMAPDVLGLTDVENRKVLEDLVAEPAIAGHQYQIVHFDSPDPRGIDVALLFKPDHFTVTSQRAVPMALPDTTLGTRDVLVVEGQLHGEPITFMVCHWPSRRNKVKSDGRRFAIARQTRKLVDEQLTRDPQARVLVMGNFNDTPTDSSLTGFLRAAPDARNLAKGQLYNPFATQQAEGKGTLYFRGHPDVFDQMILSAGLANGKGLHYRPGSADIYAPVRLTSPESKFTGEPLRTYGGKKYLGGFSDHFPVYLTLTK